MDDAKIAAVRFYLRPQTNDLATDDDIRAAADTFINPQSPVTVARLVEFNFRMPRM